jgi:hypothetical protein
MFEAAFMRVALVASLAASLPLSTIGVYLILRRMVFLGLVLANAATVGTAVAQLLAWPPEITAIIAALTAAIALGVMPSPRHVPAESINGWGYAAAASATVLILARTTAAEVDTLHPCLRHSASHTVAHCRGGRRRRRSFFSIEISGSPSCRGRTSGRCEDACQVGLFELRLCRGGGGRPRNRGPADVS